MNAALKNSRSATTLSRDDLMRESQRREMGARIKGLRERSPFTQPEVADKLGIRLRGYQDHEVRGTTKYERVEELAEIFGVEADWIWYGEERDGTRPASEIEAKLDALLEASMTPHPPAESDSASEELERKLDVLLAQQTQILAAVDRVHKEQERLRRTPEPSSRRSASRTP